MSRYTLTECLSLRGRYANFLFVCLRDSPDTDSFFCSNALLVSGTSTSISVQTNCWSFSRFSYHALTNLVQSFSGNVSVVIKQALQVPNLLGENQEHKPKSSLSQTTKHSYRATFLTGLLSPPSLFVYFPSYLLFPSSRKFFTRSCSPPLVKNSQKLV